MYAVRLSDIGDTGDAAPAGLEGDTGYTTPGFGGDRVVETPEVAKATKITEVWRR